MSGITKSPEGLLLGEAGAIFSDDRRFRFALWRQWRDGEIAHFCMLNPSVADETELDPTLRRVKGFVERWGLAGFVITNLFPLVATDPRVLIRTVDREGPRTGFHYLNHDYIEQAAERSVLTVLGWGANLDKAALRGSERSLYHNVLKPFRPRALRTTRTGQPIHPLYLPYDLEPVEWTAA